ncbi:uncharacterized protein LOC134830115 [Culicoides brevitarsis]|uniref:uncharacterized protein LOC134830115 n=1 Tax=Culicoides brevitarsis TaxID=469753 RepID=UPI00307C21C3
MPDLLDYFQSLSTQEGTSINESFICCVQCFTHGINKIFCKSNVQELRHHLLEFHAIVLDENQCEEKFERKKKYTSTRQNIWRYFERNENGEQICKKCKSENINTKYSAHTSSSNLKLHLETKHGFKKTEENNSQKKSKPAVSEVWKYFCKPTRKGNVVDNHYVYCGKCLESKKKTRYNLNTSTSSLKRHLFVAHKINVSDQNSPTLLFSDNDEEEIVDISEIEHKKRAKRITTESAIRRYFKLHSDHSWCLVCEREGEAHKFSQNTSSMILKRHLIVCHQIDPYLDSSENFHEKVDIPSDVLKRAQEIIEQKPSRPKMYFIQLEQDLDVVYCCFCLVKEHKQGYKQSTSETNLKLHLSKCHSLSYEEKKKTFKPDQTISETTLETAQNVCKTKGLKPREYFIPIPDESKKLIFCTFCMIKSHKQGYSTSTSPTNLLRHLKLTHNFDPRNIENDHETECNEEKQSESPSSVHQVFLCTENSTSSKNINYCRSCGKNEISFSSKFSSPFIVSDENEDSEHLTLGDVYRDVTGIEIFPDDGMSQTICFPCEANLKIAYHFKRQSMKTEDKMIQKFSIDQPIDVPKKNCEFLEEFLDDDS